MEQACSRASDLGVTDHLRNAQTNTYSSTGIAMIDECLMMRYVSPGTRYVARGGNKTHLKNDLHLLN